MAGPKPFEQWPTRTAAALDMRAKGWTTAQIAKRLGISVNAAAGLLSSAQRKVKPARVGSTTSTFTSRPMPAEAGYTVSIIIPANTYAQLIDAARVAAKTPAEFVKLAVLSALQEAPDDAL